MDSLTSFSQLPRGAGGEEEGETERERERETRRTHTYAQMGFLWSPRERSWVQNQRMWIICLGLALFVAVFHLTASHSSYLSKSFRGWSWQPDLNYLDFRNEGFGKIEKVKQNSSSHRPSKVMSKKARKPPRVAICLVGGARSFELTGLSIKKHVLDVYNSSDIFLHVPLDDDAHKLTLLKGASKLVMARVFENDYVAESIEAQEVLTGANSPNGIQGLLQYFRLVEGCLSMISTYETKHGFKYDWIVRTRVDGYWNGPLPRLKTLNRKFYHVPYGSQYGGLNDRLGIGTRNTSWPALSRLGLLPKLHENGYRFLNSETAFKAQLKVSNVKVRFDDFRFCILTSRKYAWPISTWGVPVASIKSKGALNGAKCKPCHPIVTGEAATEALNLLNTGWGWIHPVKDLQLCDSSGDPEPGWESMFDEVSGSQLAHVRVWITDRTVEECIKEVHQFGKLWEIWDAPSPEILCRKDVQPDTQVNSSEPAR